MNYDAAAKRYRENKAIEAKCAICETDPATVSALWDDCAVRVCQPCYEYETGEEVTS